MKQKAIQNDVANNVNSVSDNTKNFERFEFGFSFGAGAAIPLMEKIALSLEIRNNLGLTNLSKISGTSLKTNSTQLMLGMVYSL